MEQLKKYIINNKLTLLSDSKLNNFYNAILDIKQRQLAGSSAELGAYRGGGSLFISTLLEKKHYVFDTFSGITNSGEFDKIANGSFANVNENSVRQLLKNTKSVIIKGYFNGDIADELFCFSHFDGDTYTSCLDFLKYFYKNTVKNGYLFFDDYNFDKAPGVTKAITEFLIDNNEHTCAYESANHQFCIIK